MLRNPAYKGAAGFGKPQTAPRQRAARPVRLRGGIPSRDSAHHERPQDEWIAIPVPPIIDEQTFALAQERLEANKTRAPRRTVVPSVVQGLVSCANCGYALYRTSTRSSARTIYYYRCLGSDAWRRLGGPPDPPRSSRSGRMDRDRQAARRARPDPERARPPAGSRTPHRSDKASRRWASARSRSSAKEHRAPTHRLPRRPSFAR